MSAFPWPEVPEPTDVVLIRESVVFGQPGVRRTMLGVAQRLEAAIDAAGYFERRYLGLGCDGFAIVLDLEQIQPGGRRKPGLAGFAPPQAEAPFSLVGYLQRLFDAPEGRYRQIVFIVTEDRRSADSAAAPTAARLRAIAGRGDPRLPRAFDDLAFTPWHRVEALVYEFRKGRGDGEVSLVPQRQGMGALVHLQQSGLMPVLPPRPR